MSSSAYILCFLYSLGGCDGHVFEEWPHNIMSDFNIPTGLFFVCVAVLQGTLFDLIVEHYKLAVPGYAFVILLSLIWGFGAKYSEILVDYVQIIFTNYLKVLFVPGILFYVALSLDSYALSRCWKQVFVISVVAQLITVILFAIPTKTILNDLTYAEAAMLGALLTTTFPIESVEMFKETKQFTRHLHVLLQAECLIGTAVGIAIYFGTMKYINNKVPVEYVMFTLFLRLTGGIIGGCIMGHVCCLIIKSISTNPELVTITSAIFPLTSFYLLEEYTFISGTLMVTVIGLQIGNLRVSLPSDVECYLLNFWKLFGSICKNTLATGIGVYFGMILLPEISFEDIPYILLTYISIYFLRLVSFALLYVILANIEHGMSLKSLALGAWSAPRTIISGIVLFSKKDKSTEDIIMKMHFFFIHIVFAIILSLIINVPVTKMVIRITRLSEVSLARKINMTSCMKHILTMRENTIAVLKMDRFLSDANWPLVLRETLIQHPYKIQIEVAEKKNGLLLEARPTLCPDCLIEIPKEPTNAEFTEMVREARVRVLKTQKIFYRRQYISGAICREVALKLNEAVELAIESDGRYFVIDSIQKSFRKEELDTRVKRIIFYMWFDPIGPVFKPPSLYWRRLCYNMATSITFEAITSILAYFHVVPNVLQLVYNIKYETDIYFTVLSLIHTSALIQLLQLALNILAFSWGMFRDIWLVLQLIAFIATCQEIIFVILYPPWYLRQSKTGFLIQVGFMVLKSLLLLKILRLLRLLRIFRRPIKYLEEVIYDQKLAVAYELGKAFVYGEQRTLELIDFLIDSEDIRNDAKTKIVSAKLTIIKELCIIFKSRPWIANGLKTKMAIQELLYSMLDTAKELKTAGWINDIEYNKLWVSLRQKISKVHSIKNIKLFTPEFLIHEIPWLSLEENIIYFLNQHATTRVLNIGDIIVEEGQHAEGIYIVVTGILKLTYEPNKCILEGLRYKGHLPVMDFINSYHFDEKFEDYIFSGHCFGELGTITGRPYVCKIVVDTPSQVLFLKKDIIFEAMRRSPDLINGLEERIWKFICIQLSVSLLLRVPVYRKLMVEVIKLTLQRAFVVKMGVFKTFVVDENIEDLLLIEGMVTDQDTRELYVAPCYIPRTIKTINLNVSNYFNVICEVEAKMLIIPLKDVDEYELMSRAQSMSQVREGLENIPLFLAPDHKKKHRGIIHIGKRNEKVTRDSTSESSIPASLNSFSNTVPSRSSKSVSQFTTKQSLQFSATQDETSSTKAGNRQSLRLRSVTLGELENINIEPNSQPDDQTKNKSSSSSEGVKKKEGDEKE